MKKIVRQQNYLRELIDSQENKVLAKGTLKCLIRAVLEPLLDKPEEGVVLYRILNKDGILGLIKRLEFSDIESFDFSDESGNLREKVWAGTEFICVMTQRFVSIILWDNRTDDEDTVRYYSICNSKHQNESLDIINRNTIIDVKKYQERFKPDRRDNKLLNSSIRRLIENLDEASKDAVIGYAEVQNEKPEVYNDETRFIAHEVKNQLSICDLYSEVIRKYCIKNNIKDKTIKNAADCITRAVIMGNNSLLSLKSVQSNALNTVNLKELVDNVKDLTKVYFECKNIKYTVENKINIDVLADKDKLTGVLVNLIKNAAEAFDDVRDGKYIKIVTEKREEFAIIKISNNAAPVKNPEKAFDKGYTTKLNGSGLGLYICKKFMEEQFGQLKLEHTGDDYTEFVITIGLV